MSSHLWARSKPPKDSSRPGTAQAVKQLGELGLSRSHGQAGLGQKADLGRASSSLLRLSPWEGRKPIWCLGGKLRAATAAALLWQVSALLHPTLLWKFLKLFGGSCQKYHILTNFFTCLGAFHFFRFELFWKMLLFFTRCFLLMCSFSQWFNWEFDLTQVTFWVMERPVRTERETSILTSVEEWRILQKN